MVFTPWNTARGDADQVILPVANIVSISPGDDSVDTNTIILTGDGTIISFGACPYIVTKLIHFMPTTVPVVHTGIENPPQITDPLAPTSTLATIVTPPEGGTTTGDGTYPRDSAVTVTATANDNFAFVNWSFTNGLVASTDAIYTFVLTANNTVLLANFRPATIGLIHSPLLQLLTGGDRTITTEAYGNYRCHGDDDWREISFDTVGPDTSALIAALDRRVTALEERLKNLNVND